MLRLLTDKKSFGHPETFGFDPSFAGIAFNKNIRVLGYFIVNLNARAVNATPIIVQQELYRKKVDDEYYGNTLLSDFGVKQIKIFFKNKPLESN